MLHKAIGKVCKLRTDLHFKGCSPNSEAKRGVVLADTAVNETFILEPK